MRLARFNIQGKGGDRRYFSEADWSTLESWRAATAERLEADRALVAHDPGLACQPEALPEEALRLGTLCQRLHTSGYVHHALVALAGTPAGGRYFDRQFIGVVEDGPADPQFPGSTQVGDGHACDSSPACSRRREVASSLMADIFSMALCLARGWLSQAVR